MNEREQQIDDVMSSFRRVNHAFQQLVRQDAEYLSVSSTQLMVLRKLTLYPDIGVSELAELLHLGNSAASGIVDRMVKSGLITRQRSESDKRSCKLALTETGQTIRDRSLDSLRERLQPLQLMPEHDVAELLRLHEAVIQIMEQGREQRKL